MSEQLLVSVDEAARQLGMAKSSLYRMSALNLIPVYKIGPKKRGVRLSMPEVLASLRRSSNSGEGLK
jgi:excisionase family DNA binding protein